MFEHPFIKGANQYLIEVALDSSGHSFQHPVASSKDSSTAALISHFEFGKKYVWRYTGLYKGKQLGWNGPYNFEILNSDLVNKKMIRVRVLQNDSTLNAGGLITLDVPRVIVDRNGNFVWFLPPDTGNAQQAPIGFSRAPSSLIRSQNITNFASISSITNDLRFSPAGTITLLDRGKAEERNLKGNILWRAPNQVNLNSDQIDETKRYEYSHCFKKLANGNYMVIAGGNAFFARSILGNLDTVNDKKDMGNDDGEIIVGYEMIEEFDRNDSLVWSWSSKNYFDSIELKSMLSSKPDKGLLNRTPGGHMNAFDVDEKNGFVYAGFRNVSRVIKIDKKSGQVVCAWGAGIKYRGAPNGNGFFLKQHETSLLHDNAIAVFNNGNFQPADAGGAFPRISSVVIFTQPSDSINSRLIWKFDCRFDSLDNLSIRGGSVDEMKNGNLLVDMGTVNRVFEVTRTKRVVWNALIEKFNPGDSSWQPLALYRAHYTSSLYPCYFTIQTNVDTLTDKVQKFQLRIFNDGTEEDTYQVNISSKTGVYKKQFTTDIVTGRKSIRFEIAPEKIPTANDIIEVSVTSKTNPDLKRSVNVRYNR